MLKELADSKFLKRLMEYNRASLDALKRLQVNNLPSDKVLKKIRKLEFL